MKRFTHYVIIKNRRDFTTSYPNEALTFNVTQIGSVQNSWMEVSYEFLSHYILYLGIISIPFFSLFQYILINCPAISRLEWHPFTLTSVSYIPSHQAATGFFWRGAGVMGAWGRRHAEIKLSCGRGHTGLTRWLKQSRWGGCRSGRVVSFHFAYPSFLSNPFYFSWHLVFGTNAPLPNHWLMLRRLEGAFVTLCLSNSMIDTGQSTVFVFFWEK